MSLGRQRGFTLVELMVVVVASSVVIAGAMALHTTFNRQNERLQKVAEVQQTLRIARQYVERQLRLAGSGLGNADKSFTLPMAVGGTCYDRIVGGVQIHNKNVIADYLQDPPLLDAGHTNEADPDPDWFEFAYVDANARPATLQQFQGQGNSVQAVVNNIAALANVAECTSMVNFGRPGGLTCAYALSRVQSSANHINMNPQGCNKNPCMDQAGSRLPRSPNDCICNPTANKDYADFVSANLTEADPCSKYAAGMPIMSIGPGLGGVRLVPAMEATFPNATSYPFALLSRAKLESQYYSWYALADLVEDIQLEVFLNNGVIVGSAGNRRDVLQPEWAQMRAIRYTIIGASRTPVGPSLEQKFIYADRCLPPNGCTHTDGRLRRMVQGTVQLRNYGL